MSTPLQLHDIACLPAPPFGQAFDVLLRIVPLDLFHRPELHGVAANECLDRDDDRVENADLSGIGQPVQHGDDPILLRVEPLLGPAYDFCAFSHSLPTDPASWCGIKTNPAFPGGSIQIFQNLWDVLAHPSQNSRSHLPSANGSGAPIPPGPLAPLPTLHPVRGPVGTACASAQAFYSRGCA